MSIAAAAMDNFKKFGMVTPCRCLDYRGLLQPS
jgi:hypothetical protein